MHINLTPQGLTTGMPERGDHAWPATARLLLPAGQSAAARMHEVTRLGMETNRHILTPQGLAKAVTERYGCEGDADHGENKKRRPMAASVEIQYSLNTETFSICITYF